MRPSCDQSTCSRRKTKAQMRHEQSRGATSSERRTLMGKACPRQGQTLVRRPWLKTHDRTLVRKPCPRQGHTLVRKPWPKTLRGRGRPAESSIPGQYTAWKRRMSFPIKWMLAGHPFSCTSLRLPLSPTSPLRPRQHVSLRESSATRNSRQLVGDSGRPLSAQASSDECTSSVGSLPPPNAYPRT